MRLYLFLVFWLFCFSVLAQNNGLPSGPFIRIYDEKGEKIAKGKVLSVSDSVLTIGSDQRNKSVLIQDVFKVETKRSKGHLPLVLGMAGFAVGATFGAISTRDFNQTFDYELLGLEGTLLTGMYTALGSSIIGLAISLSKNYETYNIEGDPNKLKSAIYEIDKMN